MGAANPSEEKEEEVQEVSTEVQGTLPPASRGLHCPAVPFLFSLCDSRGCIPSFSKPLVSSLTSGCLHCQEPASAQVRPLLGSGSRRLPPQE